MELTLKPGEKLYVRVTGGTFCVSDLHSGGVVTGYPEGGCTPETQVLWNGNTDDASSVATVTLRPRTPQSNLPDEDRMHKYVLNSIVNSPGWQQRILAQLSER